MRPVPTMRIARLFPLALAAAAMAASTGPSMAGDRSVTILQGVDEPPALRERPPILAAPTALTTQNTAGLSLAIVPGTDLPLGTRIAFTVSTQRPGYLVIVDINAEGRITQIFPNLMSLSQSSADLAAANLVKPGAAVTIPNAKNPLARFTFTADEPRGAGAIVAMLSERPVQLIDLPDVPSSVQGLQATVDALDAAVAGLKIAAAGNDASFTGSAWSFAAVPYTIR